MNPDIPAEQRLLGALLLDHRGQWIGEVSAVVDETTFGVSWHGDAYGAIVAAYARHGGVDIQPVLAELRELGYTGDGGKGDDLTGYMSLPTSPSSAVYEARRVAEVAARRRLNDVANRASALAVDESVPVEDAYQQLRETLDETRSSEPLRVLWRDDLASLGDVTWLVDDLIPHGLSVVYGASGSLKTFWALDLAASIASGHRFYGHRVDHGPVLYVLAEGQSGAEERIQAWEQDRQASAVKLAVSPDSRALDEPKDQARLLQVARQVRPRLIVVDTVRRNMRGSENESDGMQAMVSALDDIRRHTDASSLLVHHTGATEFNRHRMRGSQVLYEAADCVIHSELDETRADCVKFTNRKQKHASEWSPLSLRTRPVGQSVVLGTDGAPVIRESRPEEAFA